MLLTDEEVKQVLTDGEIGKLTGYHQVACAIEYAVINKIKAQGAECYYSEEHYQINSKFCETFNVPLYKLPERP